MNLTQRQSRIRNYIVIMLVAIIKTSTYNIAIADTNKNQKIFYDAYELQKSGKLKEAAAKYERGLKTDPDNAAACYFLAETYSKLNKISSAKIYWHKTVKIDRNGNYGLLAIERLNNPAGGVDQQINSKTIIKNKINAAADAYEQKRYSESVRLLEEITRLDSRNARAWYFLGDSLSKTGNSDGARSAYEKVIELERSGDISNHALLSLTKLPKQIFRDCPSCPEMIVIPPGTYQMGSPPDEVGRRDNEGPQHEVSIKKFAMAKFETTIREYREFAESTGYKTDAERNFEKDGCFILRASDSKQDWVVDRTWFNLGISEWLLDFQQYDTHPVVCVSYDDSIAYITWLSNKTGKAYRLPSEAEWEFSARSGTTLNRYWGDDVNKACSNANIADQSTTPDTKFRFSYGKRFECNDGYWFTSPVGSYQPNDFGLFDMIGNVEEWNSDCWNDGYLGSPNGVTMQSGKCKRVRRGGGWAANSNTARSAFRTYGGQNYRSDDIGFRVARDFQ